MPGSSPGMTSRCLPARSRQTQLKLPNAVRAGKRGLQNPHDEVADARRWHVLVRAAAAGNLDRDAGGRGIDRNAGGGGADRYPGRGRRGRGNVAAGADAVDIAEWRNASVGGGGGRKGDAVGMRRIAHAVTVGRIVDAAGGARTV